MGGRRERAFSYVNRLHKFLYVLVYVFVTAIDCMARVFSFAASQSVDRSVCQSVCSFSRLLVHTDVQLNPDNSSLQGKSKKVRVIEGKISKKITWRGIEKGSS